MIGHFRNLLRLFSQVKLVLLTNMIKNTLFYEDEQDNSRIKERVKINWILWKVISDPNVVLKTITSQKSYLVTIQKRKRLAIYIWS